MISMKSSEFCLIEEEDDEGNPIWSLGMKLAGARNDKNLVARKPRRTIYQRDFVFQINEFTRKQIAPSEMIFEYEDESDDGNKLESFTALCRNDYKN